MKEGPLVQDYLISSFHFNSEVSGGPSRQHSAKHRALCSRALLY